MANYKRLFLSGYSYFITIVTHQRNYTPIDYVKQSQSREKRGLKAVWQKRYYEDTIRNQKDWAEKMQYIQYNPIKHNLVKNINDWKYSSFA